jgi:Lrp/AsnC family transcriptional regulator, leucine-responsive regulatory protein
VEHGAADEVRLRWKAVAAEVPVDTGSLPGSVLDGQSDSKALSSVDRMSHGLLSRTASNRAAFDRTDRRIIGELAQDGRVSFAELGRRVNLSAPAVAERVQRLERAGVIVGYRAELDPRALGYPLTAIVRVRPAPGRLPRIPELALEIPEVVECHRITGEDCFYLKVALRSIDELGPLLDRFLDYGETTTSIVNASPIPRRDPPVPEA